MDTTKPHKIQQIDTTKRALSVQPTASNLAQHKPTNKILYRIPTQILQKHPRNTF